jgi:hypothetical protein
VAGTGQYPTGGTGPFDTQWSHLNLRVVAFAESRTGDALSRPADLFLIPPHLALKNPVRCLHRAHHRAGAAPSAFLVESCCQVVADHAGEPSRRHAAIGDARLGVGEQRSRDASAARLARDEKLIELVILDHAEP